MARPPSAVKTQPSLGRGENQEMRSVRPPVAERSRHMDRGRIVSTRGHPVDATEVPRRLPISATADDVELMARVARAEPAAQRSVVRRLLGRVQRLCRALLRNTHDAQDAAQLSMLEILRSARSFRGDSSLERWSDRITVRTALRASRSEKRAQRTPIDAEPERVNRAVGEDVVLAQEYLLRLSERQRTVLVLRHAFEYSIDEIAELSGISANTVKDRLLRGRGLMRKMFRREQLLRRDRRLQR